MASITRKAAFIHSPQMEQYQYPADCPFNVSRAGKVRELVNSMGALSGPGRSEVAPVPAKREELKKFHTARYLHILKSSADGQFESEAFNMGLGTPDCPVFKDMYEYSVMACGATLTGMKLLLSDKADVAFNPSGGLHHAGPEKASGFCYLNDNAIACTTMAEQGKKVLYLDVDVHHGDGPAYAFYDRSDIMTISLHETGRMLFPGTGFEDEIGTGQGKGYCVNIPLPVGTFDFAYLEAYRQIAFPLIGAFDPDVIVFELGTDALADDPLAHLYLTNNVYVEIIESLLSFGKPILVTGGGGYNIENTVRAWALAWCILCSNDIDLSLGSDNLTLDTTNWKDRLRDDELTVTKQQHNTVLNVVEATIERIKSFVFGFHGI